MKITIVRTRTLTRRQWRMIRDYVMYHEQVKQLRKEGVNAEVKVYLLSFGRVRISLEIKDDEVTE